MSLQSTGKGHSLTCFSGHLGDPIIREDFKYRTPPLRLSGNGHPTSTSLLSPWSPTSPKSGETLSQSIDPSIIINDAIPCLDESPKSKRHGRTSSSPPPKPGRSKSWRVSRRSSILKLFKSKDSKHQNTSQDPLIPKKTASGTFTLTGSIRSSFLAITKHHIQTAEQEERSKCPRPPCVTPFFTLPLRTSIHQHIDLYRPLSRSRSSFELPSNLSPAKPLLDTLVARDDALGFLEGRNKMEQTVEVDIVKVLEWRKEVAKDI